MKALLLLMAVITPIASSQTRDCQPGVPVEFSENGKWAYLSPEGILIQPQFRTAGLFEHGNASVCVDSGCALIDTKGNFLTPLFDPKSVHVDDFHEGLLADEKDRKWGFIDANRRVVIPNQYLYV